MSTKTKTKYRIVYKLDFYLALIEKGHQVATTIPNPKNNALVAWIFEEDDTFDEDLAELIGGARNA